jgi:threonine/homoserine/homoserine lactone efflux protein
MMISTTQLALFSSASLILIFTPGPDIIYAADNAIS